jgi:ketosteroid isomerase-like protein
MTMDQAASEAALRDVERQLQSAVRSGDVELLEQLLDDRVVYTGPDGRSLTKEEDLEAHRSRSLIVEVFDQEELQVTVAGMTGITHVLATLQGIAAGQPFTGRLRYTRTWVHAEGVWRVLAAHASSVLASGSQPHEPRS